MIDCTELNTRILQPGDKVVILRDGVGFVGVFVFVHKVNLLIFDLDGGKLLILQHLQEGTVIYALDAGLHQGREEEDIA